MYWYLGDPLERVPSRERVRRAQSQLVLPLKLAGGSIKDSKTPSRNHILDPRCSASFIKLIMPNQYDNVIEGIIKYPYASSIVKE